MSKRSAFSTFLNWYLNQGISDDQTRELRFLQNFIALCAFSTILIIFAIMFPLSFLAGDPAVSLYGLAALMLLTIFCVPMISAKGRLLGLLVLAGCLSLGCAAVSYVLGPDTGVFYCQAVLPLMVAYLTRRKDWPFVLSFAGLCLILGFLQMEHPFFSGTRVGNYSRTLVFGYVGFLTITVFFFVGVRRIYELWVTKGLEQEELLSLSIPDSIRRLGALNPKLPPAQDLTKVTLMAVDISASFKGGDRLEPSVVIPAKSLFLDRVHALAAERGLSFVNSIGGKLIVVDKVLSQEPAKPEKMFALAMALRQSLVMDPISPTLKIRPTFAVTHGALGAGLVGTEIIYFDVWGPTLGRALALLDHATPGEVLVEQALVDQIELGLGLETEEVTIELQQFGEVGAVRLGAPV